MTDKLNPTERLNPTETKYLIMIDVVDLSTSDRTTHDPRSVGSLRLGATENTIVSDMSSLQTKVTDLIIDDMDCDHEEKDASGLECYACGRTLDRSDENESIADMAEKSLREAF